jgi:ABC-type multidrug transport system ATPase subunit
MKAMASIIEICALTKNYGPNPVLRGVDLTVDSGERASLLLRHE